MDTGSLVTIMPNNPKMYKMEDVRPMNERYQEVNKIEINFFRGVNIKYNNTRMKLPLEFTSRNDVTPTLGINWLKKLPIAINKNLLDKETNQS